MMRRFQLGKVIRAQVILLAMYWVIFKRAMKNVTYVRPNFGGICSFEYMPKSHSLGWGAMNHYVKRVRKITMEPCGA